jgi:putative addiction module component (TIGR02574 family)
MKPMSVKKFFAAAEKLPFDKRVELAHRLWDEFMDGFQGWKAPPIPEGKFPWKSLQIEIDAKLSRTDRLELAQQVWSNIIENGYDWELTLEQAAELDRRIADFEKNPQDGIPFEQIQAEMKRKYGWK